jgi:hypothetical protein
MSEIEKAKIFNVTGPIDRPERSGEGISVMFNPSTLKVTLANSLKENERSGNSRAAQYVDKSSSSLSVELIFDSSIEFDQRNSVRKDVRQYTGAIANEFMKQPNEGDENAEPKRCMFAWGTFIFVGIMESFDETLELFSWEGTPLRATVSIKMTESRFQFESADAKRAKRNTPRLGRDSASPQEANQDAGQDSKNWRDTSMYNGVESPRMPSASALAVPSLSASANLSASVGVSAGVGISAGASIGASAGMGGGIGAGVGAGVGAGGSLSGGLGISAGISASASVGGGVSTSMMKSTPAFSFGASSSLGTGIPGAFSPNTKNCIGLTAGSIMAVSVSTSGVTSNSSRTTSSRLSAPGVKGSARASVNLGPKGIKTSGSLGFD